MATGAPGTNGVWQYGEDDSEATFSALLNKAASTTDTQIGADRTRLTALELPGRVIQTVTATYSTINSTTSSTFVSTGLTASITPRSATSKILIISTNNFAANTNGMWITLYRNGLAGTNLGSGNEGFGYLYSSTASFTHVTGITYLDSPATTSSTSYTFAFRSSGGSQTANYLGSKSSITLLEIAA